jgi:hypothetical protein
MEDAGVQFRMARPEDVEQIRQHIPITLANPEGKTLRKRYEDAVARNEVLVLTRYDSRERASRVVGFIEWHSKVDGTITIRDAGSVGETPQLGILRRLLRELLDMARPVSATAKIRGDLQVWNSLFEETPGFRLEGREYSRPYWRHIWTWTVENERAAARPQRPTVPAGRGIRPRPAPTGRPPARR